MPYTELRAQAERDRLADERRAAARATEADEAHRKAQDEAAAALAREAAAQAAEADRLNANNR